MTGSWADGVPYVISAERLRKIQDDGDALADWAYEQAQADAARLRGQGAAGPDSGEDAGGGS